MDALGKNMYILVDMPLEPIQTQLLLSDGTPSSLGRVKLAGTIRGSPGLSRAKMRVLGSYALVYLLHGGGEYKDASGRCERVSQGNLLWIFPELPHFYGPSPRSRWDEIYFLFEGPLFELWRDQKIITPEKPVWRLEPLDFWFGRLKELARPAAPGPQGMLRRLGHWQILVADMIFAMREAGQSSPPWLEGACQLLEQEGDALSLPDIARLTGFSYETFRKKFSEALGLAPAKYRQARLIERACTFLMQRNLSHRQIAERLGFCDEFHFSKVFRQHMGISPRAFRGKALGSASAGKKR